MAALNEAYEVLSNPGGWKRRYRYSRYMPNMASLLLHGHQKQDCGLGRAGRGIQHQRASGRSLIAFLVHLGDLIETSYFRTLGRPVYGHLLRSLLASLLWQRASASSAPLTCSSRSPSNAQNFANATTTATTPTTLTPGSSRTRLRTMEVHLSSNSSSSKEGVVSRLAGRKYTFNGDRPMHMCREDLCTEYHVCILTQPHFRRFGNPLKRSVRAIQNMTVFPVHHLLSPSCDYTSTFRDRMCRYHVQAYDESTATYILLVRIIDTPDPSYRFDFDPLSRSTRGPFAS